MHSPVPALAHSLSALSKILGKAEEHCEAQEIEPKALLNARLFPDMLDFKRNVMVACDTSKGAAARLSETENPVFEDNETTFAELQQRIQKTLDFMNSVSADAFEGAENRTVKLKAGKYELEFTGASYLSTFAIPNFYFHMTTAYDILRHNGVVLGKKDFLGG